LFNSNKKLTMLSNSIIQVRFVQLNCNLEEILLKPLLTGTISYLNFIMGLSAIAQLQSSMKSSGSHILQKFPSTYINPPSLAGTRSQTPQRTQRKTLFSPAPSPLTVCGTTFPNRIFLAPICACHCKGSMLLFMTVYNIS